MGVGSNEDYQTDGGAWWIGMGGVAGADRLHWKIIRNYSRHCGGFQSSGQVRRVISLEDLIAMTRSAICCSLLTLQGSCVALLIPYLF